VGHANPRAATVLIGLRGSGKTTLGRLLAARRKSDFIDLDDRTVAGSGHATVSAFFRAAGERAFRQAEARALARVLDEASPGAVIALGGGTPTAPGARELLERARAAGRAWVVLLEAPAAVLGARLSAAPGDRPLLMGTDFAQEAALLGERRLPGYRAIADSVVTTAGDAAESLAELERTSVPG
jgi:shikimate kinase